MEPVVTRDEQVVTVVMDLQAARVLTHAVYQLGEHIAAGMPIKSYSQEDDAHLGAVYQGLLLVTEAD